MKYKDTLKTRKREIYKNKKIFGRDTDGEFVNS